MQAFNTCRLVPESLVQNMYKFRRHKMRLVKDYINMNRIVVIQQCKFT